MQQIPLVSIFKIPAFGAVSIKINPNTWDNVGTSDEAVLRVKVAASSPALTVSMLSENVIFTGGNLLDEIPHKSYKTSEKSEHIFESKELVPMFITLLNPTARDVRVTDVAFEIRSTLLPPVIITSPANNSTVNNRVISVTGSVPSVATTVDRVVVSNGSFKTVTSVTASGSFFADVVMTMGDNQLTVQGYNSEDLSTPLTEENIITVVGVENTLGVSNALVPSRVAFVLTWKTFGTDIDIYSLDKLGRTIYFENRVETPGFLDHDNTTGFGPEVISYRKTDDSVYQNGFFYIDVHYYNGIGLTPFSIDVILNETDPDNLNILHYDSIQSLPFSNSSDGGPTGSGLSRFNNVLGVSCNQSRICTISFIDSGKITGNPVN